MLDSAIKLKEMPKNGIYYEIYTKWSINTNLCTLKVQSNDIYFDFDVIVKKSDIYRLICTYNYQNSVYYYHTIVIDEKKYLDILKDISKQTGKKDIKIGYCKVLK